MAGEAQVVVANWLIRQVTGNPAIKGKFADFGTLFPSFDAKLSLDPPVKVFVTGDRQNGKSTLIRSLRAESSASGIPFKLLAQSTAFLL